MLTNTTILRTSLAGTEEGFIFRKIIFFATHPQRMFYERQGSSIWQDLVLEAASCVTELVEDDGQFSKKCEDTETEAGVAYAKVKAVYPTIRKEDLKVDMDLEHCQSKRWLSKVPTAYQLI